jgi:hypothetical protein
VYDLQGQEPLRYYGWVEIVLFSYYQALVDYLDGCNGVSGWDSWLALEYAIWSQGDGAWEWWDITAGEMTLGKGNDITAVATGNEVENFDTMATGTLAFDLEAPLCAKAK